MIDFKAESPEVLYTTQDFSTVGAEEIAMLKARAGDNPRRRCRLCFHRDPAGTLHDMLIVIGQNAYVQPHLHIGKEESLHVVEGAAVVLTFDETGDVTRAFDIGAPGTDRPFFYRMPEQSYHSLLIASEWLVFHESTIGPFDPSKTRAAPWSPSAGEPVEAYLEHLWKVASDHGASPLHISDQGAGF